MPSVTRKKLCSTKDVPENALKEVRLEDGFTVVVANAGGSYFACQASCPHQEVPLCEGLLDGTVLTCHMHLWQWDIRTGEPQGLAEAPLQTYGVSVEKGVIYLVPPRGRATGKSSKA